MDRRRSVGVLILLLLTIAFGFLSPSMAAGEAFGGELPPAPYGYDAPTDALSAAREGSREMGVLLQALGSDGGPAPSYVAPSPTPRTPVSLASTPSAPGLADDALQYATRAEKLDHIFVPRHNLDPLVRQFGSREAVVEQMLRGVGGRTPASGVFEIPVSIGGQTVVVWGAVVDGVVKLGTAFTP